MFGYIIKKIRFRKIRNENDAEQGRGAEGDLPAFSEDLEENLKALKLILGKSGDIVLRRFTFGYKNGAEAALLFIDGLVDKSLVHENIMKPLMLGAVPAKETSEGSGIAYIKSALLYVGDLRESASVREAVEGFLSGDTILLVNGSKEALIISLRGWQNRSIEEPLTESTVRGPRDGFTETLRVNTMLLRRKIRCPDLTFETVQIGVRTRTDVCIAYIDGLASPGLIEEIKKRLGRINTDAILESGYIEQFIEDAPFSIFSTVANSERPDKIAAKLLEGRAAILVDGTPFVLTVPTLFIESFQAAEDYYSRPYFASVIRLLRYLAFFISVLAPALYVAMATFHQELIPTPLLLTVASAHEGTPFPSVLEAGLMVIIFEILREAGVRLPRPVGSAVSIVGALVIGDAAVSAGLIGAPMVIVVAMTAVSSFVVPPQTDAGAIMRLSFLILAGMMGGYGIAIGLFAVFVHLASLRSFGTPYLSAVAPFSKRDMKDTFIRAPLWSMRKRPENIAAEDKVRQGTGLTPAPPEPEHQKPEA
ncbi:MAG TPA: spore germination protein [Oscillospiraceae bacterium]|nr:spore germination protein [Oscillospiraceae bacterium]